MFGTLRRTRLRWRRLVGLVLLGVLGLLLLIQVIPYGRQHTNPAVQAEPLWDSPLTRSLAQRACMDCHGNQTKWPWYSNIAPVSWLVQHDVDGARERLNFSEWNLPQRDANRAARVVQRGGMPPSYFVWLHSQANLTAAEKQQLEQGLQQTIAQDPPGSTLH